jgi:sucrose phosphorylase
VGIDIIRLDAAGYAIKKAGTSCFIIPETFSFIAELAEEAHALGIEVLVEIHSHHLEQIEIARRVDWVYDFALPPLILHTLYTRNARALKQWLGISPRNAITVLDTHDGIGVIDIGSDPRDHNGRPGLLSPQEIDDLVETIHLRSNHESREATGSAASNLDLYQVNCTFYDALGRNDNEYLIARAMQFFAPGIPQVYYVGLLAGSNDMELLGRSRVGRDINRHYYTPGEVTEELARPVVQGLLHLIRIRNQHRAFGGDFHLEQTSDDDVVLEWRRDPDWARLEVNLAAPSALITLSTPSGSEKILVTTRTSEVNA